MERLKAETVRVSVISLSAEIHICKKIAEATNGTHHVILNESHYNDLVHEKVYPPLLDEVTDISSLIRMGFPTKLIFQDISTLCSWCVYDPCDKLSSHLSFSHMQTVQMAYKCPNCSSIVCSLPSDCSVCGLSLISSPLLARSYHHLFPVKSYDEVDTIGGYLSYYSFSYSSTSQLRP